jgi:hypothetical protein
MARERTASANVRLTLEIGFLAGVLALALTYPVLPRFSTAATANQAPQPLWEIDLSEFGYQGRPPIHLGPEDVWGNWTYEQGVVFTAPNVTAAFFVVHDDPQGDAADNRKPSPSKP